MAAALLASAARLLARVAHEALLSQQCHARRAALAACSSSATSTSQRALATQPDLARWMPGLKPLSAVPDLARHNDELAGAYVRDRASARQRLFNELPHILQQPPEASAAPLAPVTVADVPVRGWGVN